MNPVLLFVSIFFFQNTSFINKLSSPHVHWHLLARVKTSIEETNKEIQLPSDKGIFTGLQFRITGSELDLKKCEVIFSDGTRLEFLIQQRISKGEKSKSLELKSNFKVIEKLTVWYTFPGKITNATSIELYGKH